MLKLRKYLLLLISLVIGHMTFPTSLACGWEERDVRSSSIFIPEIVSDKSFDNYFLSMYEFYSNYDTSAIYNYRHKTDTSSLAQLNLNEWIQYWPVKQPMLLNSLIYKSSVKVIDGMLTKLKSAQKVNGVYAPLFSHNSKLAALEYLKLAKQIENAVNKDPYGSWESPELNIPEIRRLADLAKACFLKTQDRFLKVRYGYQYVRCCFFSNNYSGGIQFFDANYLFTPNDGHIYYRALGYKAASHYKLRQYDKANLIYARMYGAYNAFKDIVIQSFHVQNENDWSQTLSMAATMREKELLWHLLGVYSDPVRGMREIAALNPQSDLLPLLMVRAVNIAEYNVFLQNIDIAGNTHSEYIYDESANSTPGNSWKSVLRENLDDLYSVLTFIRSKRTHDNAAWAVAQSFVMLLKGDYKACIDQSKNALNSEGVNPLVRAQAAINIVLAKSKTLSIVGSAEENEVYKLLNDLSVSGQKPTRAINAESYVLTVLSKIYKDQGNLMLAELAQPGMHKYFDDEFKIYQLIEFLSLKQGNLLHNYLKKKYPHSLMNIYDLLAIYKIYKGDLLGAQNIYTAHPAAGAVVLAGNPFSSRIVDCHDCDHYMPQKRKYTKKQFVDELISLKRKAVDATQSKVNRAKNYFNYANGLYNMTYYGNARLVKSNTALNSHEYYYSPYFSEYNGYSDRIYPNGYFDCNQALNNYLNALNLNVSKEFNAVCVWMAAKCEHNLWLETSYNDGQNGDFRSGIYFNKMRDEFYNTKFYNEVINECGYFCQYIRPGDYSCIKEP